MNLFRSEKMTAQYTYDPRDFVGSHSSGKTTFYRITEPFRFFCLRNSLRMHDKFNKYDKSCESPRKSS